MIPYRQIIYRNPHDLKPDLERKKQCSNIFSTIVSGGLCKKSWQFLGYSTYNGFTESRRNWTDKRWRDTNRIWWMGSEDLEFGVSGRDKEVTPFKVGWSPGYGYYRVDRTYGNTKYYKRIKFCIISLWHKVMGRIHYIVKIRKSSGHAGGRCDVRKGDGVSNTDGT